MSRPLRVSEELPHKKMIDPLLETARWFLRAHSRVKIEIPVDGYDAEPWSRVSDYCLYREIGEAKETTRDARLTDAQLIHYIPEIEKLQTLCSFGFLANGYEIYCADVGIRQNDNADQLLFLRAVQSLFLQKPYLDTGDLYEPPLDMFVADAVERWFTKKEGSEIVEFTKTSLDSS